MKKSLGLALAALALSACGGGAPIEAKQDKTAIRSLITELYELEADCSRQGPNGLDLPDATSFGIGARDVVGKNDPGADGREEELCAAGGSVRFGPVIAEVKIFTDNAAIAYGTSTYEEIDGEGTAALIGEFNWTQVLKRTPDGWKIQHTHVAPLFPEE